MCVGGWKGDVIYILKTSGYCVDLWRMNKREARAEARSVGTTQYVMPLKFNTEKIFIK